MKNNYYCCYKNMDTYLVLILTLEIFTFSYAAFPSNLEPKIKLEFGELQSRLFIGDELTVENQLRYLQIIKRIEIDGKETIFVASRDNLYLLSPDQFSASREGNVHYDAVLTWTSNEKSKRLCSMKGNSEELCQNYLSVVEKVADNKILVCGSNSYDPMCGFYNVTISNDGKYSITKDDSTDFPGKQKSPFGPNQQSASLFTGGSLYSATFQDFQGSSPVIARTMGEAAPLRTPSMYETMNDPHFISMAEDEDHVFIFFNEMREVSKGESKMTSQVAQVCKNDVGGDRVLQRMWTTYIKSRLNCSYNGFYLNQLLSVSDPVRVNGVDTVYATFTTPENSLPGSAVCSFTLDAIRAAMLGTFQVTSGYTSDNVGTELANSNRHPGSCPHLILSDEELMFIKNNPQMEKQVEGSLLATNQGSRWSTVAVDVTAGPDDVTMLYIGTSDGYLIRSLAPTKEWPRGADVMEQNVFDKDSCSSVEPSADDKVVMKIEIDSDNNLLVVAFRHCIISIPIYNCGVYKCKSGCIGSANPYCGWGDTTCDSYWHISQNLKQNLTQAINHPGDFEKCQEPVAEVTSVPKFVEVVSSEKETTPAGNIPQDVGKAQPNFASDSETMVPMNQLITAVALTFVGSVVLFLVLLCVVYRCRKYQAEQSNDFHKNQMNQHHYELGSQEKRSSLTRTAQSIQQGVKGWLNRSARNTPLSTPQINSKTDHPIVKTNGSLKRRRENEYSEAPTLRKSPPRAMVEQARRSRRSSSRLNSTCSVTSQRSISHMPLQGTIDSKCPPYSQPLLQRSPNEETYSNGTLQKSSPDSCFAPVTPPRSDTSSEVFVTEDGITASTKVRRKNASAKTKEIMRDSDSAIQHFNDTFHQLVKHGISQPLQQPAVAQLAARQRLDSNDSGKGESPRNSLRNEWEQPVNQYAKPLRPNSLDLQHQQRPNRKRLLSEPTHNYPYPVAVVPTSSTMQRHQQKRGSVSKAGNSSRSQPTTPVEGGSPPRLSVFNQNAAPHYATLPKNDTTAVVGRRQQQRQNQQYHQIPLQRPYSVEQGGRRSAVTRSCGSPSKSIPNSYASLQTRGSYARKPSLGVQNTQAKPPPNYYPSLQHTSSSAPYGTNVNNNNSYTNKNGFERPSTSHRREKMPSVSRHQSMSSALRPPKYVPTPTVPTIRDADML